MAILDFFKKKKPAREPLPATPGINPEKFQSDLARRLYDKSRNKFPK